MEINFNTKENGRVKLFLTFAVVAGFVLFFFLSSDREPNKSGKIEVRGDGECKNITANALLELEKAPGRYLGYVRERIGIIECAEKGSGIYVWEKPPRFVVGERTYKTNTTLKLYASAIVHDACHVEQYYSSRSYSGEMAEKECLEKQYRALEEIGGTAEELGLVRSALEKRYWEIPFEERSW